MRAAPVLIALIAVIALFQLYPQQVETSPLQSSLVDEKVELYRVWKQTYRGNAANEEIDYFRFNVWSENLDMINKHNAEGNTYSLGMNQFGDLTNEEFRHLYLTEMSVPRARKTVPISTQNANNIDINWVTRGFVGNVLNQGSCGGCWAFAAAENLASVTAINTGDLPYYSEQQLIDCSSSYGNLGCNGGVVQWAFQYVVDNGIELSSDYPFTGQQGTCKYNAKLIVEPTPLKSFVEIASGDCNALAAGIQLEPVAIAIDASNLSFYRGGVFSNCQDALNHAVLLVGYVNNNGSGYWLAENSWGTSWGEQGFFKLALGNTCGICDQATYPTLNYK